jgi:hypothetical protein
MAPPDPVQSFLPSLAAARRAGVGLPAHAPFEERRLAALRVDLKVLRRTSWSEQKSFKPEEFARLASAAPTRGKPGAAYHVAGAVLRRTKDWVRCQVHHFTDELFEVHETYVPSEISNHRELFTVERALETMIMPGRPPEELRCLDLTPKDVGGAYRAGPSTEAPDFHGFEFGDALEQATTVVHRVLGRGEVLASDVRAYALPLLWLCYGVDRPEPDYVLTVDRTGALRAIAGVVA